MSAVATALLAGKHVDHRLTLWAAQSLGRPVKWRCERSEVILADEHGRDNVGEIELALDAEGRFLGVRLHMLASIGAYIASDRQLLTPFGQIITLTGVYNIPAAHVTIDAVLSNTNPTAPYRGAGRPEAIYLIERIIEVAAAEMGIDPVELRRRNVVRPEAIPYRAPLGPVYDSGDFVKNMVLAAEVSDYAGFAVRAAESKARGKLRGIALVNAIEQAGGPVPDYAEIRFQPSGSAMMLMGTKSHGQGHETSYKQILFDKLGIDPNEAQFDDSDTGQDRVAFGMGSNGSRSMVVGGSALVLAADKIIAKGKLLAAHMMEAAETDIEFADGKFSVAGTDRSVTLKQVASASFQPPRLPKGMPPGLIENATYAPEKATYPNGSHVCEVEVDPDTGVVDLLNYVVVDDVGTIDQSAGRWLGRSTAGCAQGVGQILMEEVVYDRESGQLVTASFMDYAMPRADTMCSIGIKSNPHPTTSTLLGVKGAGEAGCVGALLSMMIAIMERARAAGGVKRTRHAGDADAAGLGKAIESGLESRSVMRTGAAYREALRDGRRVWVLGEGRVDDVTTHPATAPMVAEYVTWYDRLADPAWRDLAWTSEGASVAYMVPRSADDLVRMGRFFSATTFLGAGNITHTPAYGHMIALGIQHAVTLRNASDVQVRNAEAYRAHIAATGRFVTFAAGHATIGYRLRPDPTERNSLRIVRESDAGLVIAGKIGMHTSPAFAEDV